MAQGASKEKDLPQGSDDCLDGKTGQGEGAQRGLGILGPWSQISPMGAGGLEGGLSAARTSGNVPLASAAAV